MKRGYYGIGIYRSKNKHNIGTLWRSAMLFNADFIFTINGRYKHQVSDTMKAINHIPLFQYESWMSFKGSVPQNASIVFVEQCESSHNINNFIHPERAIYILGAEDDGIPEDLMKGHQKIFIDTPRSLNVSIAGSIVLFDRQQKY